MFLTTVRAHAISLPPNPDNAALLYYQAILLLPDYNSELIDPVLRGADPNENVRDYLDNSKEAIELAVIATEITHCNWGIIYSQGIPNLTTILGTLRQLAFLLEVDARILTADGDYRAALEKCLSLNRLAQHISGEAILGHLVSMGLNGMSLRCMQHILNTIPPDAETLTWLQGQLVTFMDPSISLFHAFEMDFEILLQSIRQDQDALEWIRGQFAENAVDENSKNEFLNMTDDELIALARVPYTSFLNAVFKTIDSDMLYVDKYLEIQRHTNELNDEYDEYDSDPVVGYFILWSEASAGQIADCYDLLVRHASNFNAIKAATEIYLVKAETGQLPETLPAHLPIDPYSSLDFEYEMTSQGFVLRCREKEIGEDKLSEYEFLVVQ